MRKAPAMAERLLRNHPAIAAEIEEAAYSIQQRAYAEAYRLHAEERKTAILSMMDKRVILARIAKCEIKVCRYIKDGDRYRMLFEDPHPREIIRAIDADGQIEDRLNRARNLSDPKLSQFYIYIDGRPCDDPTAPINDQLPPGIVMLPRRTKKLIEEHGNNLEHLSRQGDENQEKDSFPVFRELRSNHDSNIKDIDNVVTSGTNEVSDGRVDSGGTLAQDETLIAEPGINLEQNTTLSPAGGEPALYLIQGGEVRAGGGTLAPEHGNKPEHFHTHNAHHTSPPSGDLGVPPAPEKDLMSASFYEQEKQAEAAAPPPHILTDEEVRQLHAEADRKLEEKKKQPQQPYNTFGKMYFPPERR